MVRLAASAARLLSWIRFHLVLWRAWKCLYVAQISQDRLLQNFLNEGKIGECQRWVQWRGWEDLIHCYPCAWISHHHQPLPKGILMTIVQEWEARRKRERRTRVRNDTIVIHITGQEDFSNSLSNHWIKDTFNVIRLPYHWGKEYLIEGERRLYLNPLGSP